MASQVCWQNPMVPDGCELCIFLYSKFRNGLLLRQINVKNALGKLIYILAFQEDPGVSPQVGDNAIRVNYTEINSTQESITYSLITVTQEMIDRTVPQINLAPTNIALSSTTILETMGIGELVGTLSTFDPNEGDTHTYTIISDPDNKFEISGGSLRLKNLVDYGMATSHSVTIRSTDQELLFFDKVFSIIVTKIP